MAAQRRGRRGLWWGTVEGASLVELVEAAGATGFDTISVSPALYADARAAGHTDRDLRARLDDAGVTVSLVDPLIRGLPGALDPASVPRRFRATFEFGEDDVYGVADALGARGVNVAHYLGEPRPVEQLAEAIGAIAARAATHGLQVLVEFMPEGGIADLATALAVVRAVDRPDVGLMFDTWHFFRTGADPADLDAIPAGLLRAVQVSDALGDVRGTWTSPPTADRLQPGQGVIPLVELVRRAYANNPDLDIGPEVFDRPSAGEPAVARAAVAAEALDHLLESAAAAARVADEPRFD